VRLLVPCIPLLLLLSLAGDVAVWFAFPLSELVATFVALGFAKNTVSKRLNAMQLSSTEQNQRGT
jgi:hypothetical protein